jgi:uncharacterized protein
MVTLNEHLILLDTENKGRGVFTKEIIEEDTIVEIAPVIVMSKEERIHLDKTLLHDYIFEWGPDHSACCMALGLVPMYNHSYKSNCDYFMDFEEKYIIIKSVRNIAAGEELTINYNGDWDNSKKIWFETK